MEIDYFGKTDIGRVRRVNEDYFLHEKIKENEYLFVVADGMGGHQAGEVASKFGTITFANHYRKFRKKKRSIKESMLSAIKQANAAVLEMALSDLRKKGMGTTFSACVVSNMRAHIAHVGDSRIYIVRDGEIKKITRDHTFVEKMLEEGRINKEEARNHPQKNILYMSLGARETFEPDITNNVTLKKNDIIVMCSDGLDNMVPDEKIKNHCLKNDNPRETVNQLIKEANVNGGADNITVQIINIGKQFSGDQTKPIDIKTKKRRYMGFWLVIVLIVLVYFVVSNYL